MKIFIIGLALLMLILIGWQDNVDAQQHNKNGNWPKDLHQHLDKKITLIGTAHNAKTGAILAEDGRQIWIDKLDEWPADFIGSDHQGKRVKVTGTLIERDDLPAFVAKPGEVQQGGIPVASEKDLAAAKRRFLLKDAQWKLVE